MLHIKIVQPGSENVEAATDKLATEFMRLDVSFCGFDSEMTVVTAMNESEALLGDRERVIPSIVQLVVKRKINDATLSFPIEGIKDDYTCFIFPIKVFTTEGRTFPTSLIQLLRSERLVKAAVGIRNDLNMLGSALGFQIGAPLEIQTLATVAGASDLGLGALAKQFTPLEKAESAGGNYDGILSSDKIYYASLDALISHLIVETLMASSMVIEKPTEAIPLSEEEMKSMWHFLKDKIATGAGSGSEKFINLLFNSYDDWKTQGYSKQSVRNAVETFLPWAVATRRLVNPSNDVYRPASLAPPAPKATSMKTVEREHAPKDSKELLRSASNFLQRHSDTKGFTRTGIITTLKSHFIFPPGPAPDKQAQDIIDGLQRNGQLLFDSKTRKYIPRYDTNL